ncbi:MAG: gluconate 2-dehydrogenase subunit 3 family protein [Acidobacteria bacterium]|nr:gluconate 2-dehydrogenase subunit 3 family protein [Acidobacteriota bacterium]
MKRRDWLRNAITAPVGAAAVAAAGAAQQQQAAAQTPPPTNSDTPKLALTNVDAIGAPNSERFFAPGEFQALEALAKTLLPAYNGRPGAVEAGVPEFLDFLLSQSPAERQELYHDGLRALSAAGFATMDAVGQKKILAPLEQPWTYAAPKDPLAQFLRVAKDDIIQATFNSREWAASSKTRTSGGTSYYYFTIE